MRQVGISSDFFAKSLNDYSNWFWAMAREFGQNGIDSGASNMSINIMHHTDTDLTEVTVSNDGKPMTLDIIENKLMNIGGTTKTTENGDVGGFGLAKLVLYMAHHSYTIQTGHHTVEGQNGTYEIKDTPFYSGTINTVMIKGNVTDELERNFRAFANFCQWKGTMAITRSDGERVGYDCSLRKGSFRKDLSFGKLYTNKSFQNKLIFRINGIPMFQKWVNFEGCVIVEASKGSLETMTSNRDGLKWLYQREIESVIDAFTTNRSSVLREEPTIEVFGDTYIEAGISKVSVNHSEETQQNQTEPNEEPNFKTQYLVQDNNEGPTFVKLETTQTEQTNETITEIAASIDDVEAFTIPKSQTKPTSIKKPVRQTRFMIFNDSGMALPNYAKPDNMGAHFKKLSETWTKLLVKLHELNGTKSTFGIGFTVGSASAQYITHKGIQYYLINPFEIVESKNTKHLKKRFNFVNNKERIVMLAVHEYAHSFVESHNETYASVLTNLSELAMKNLKELKRCF